MSDIKKTVDYLKSEEQLKKRDSEISVFSVIKTMERCTIIIFSEYIFSRYQ